MNHREANGTVEKKAGVNKLPAGVYFVNNFYMFDVLHF